MPENYSPEIGGGYSYTTSLIRGLFSYSGTLDLVLLHGSTDKYKTKIEEQFNTQNIVFLGFENIILIRLLKIVLSLIGILTFKRSLFEKIYNNFSRPLKGFYLKKKIKEKNIGVIYYPLQAYCLNYNIPYIATNWDIGHVTANYFPEIWHYSLFRQRLYDKVLRKALLIFTESEAGKEELIKYLGIHESKIRVIPMFPTDMVKLNVTENTQQSILSKYKLVKNNFFFYPAQFWSHKNHYNLVKSFSLLLQKYQEFNLKIVFTGKDYGNQAYIVNIVESEKISSNVLFCGFVSNEELFTFYSNAISLVMPTFLGPTNMPILEAFALNCPVICSDFIGHREITGNNAIFITPDNPLTVFEAMEKILLDEKIRNNLINDAKNYSVNNIFQLSIAVEKLTNELKRISNVRNCWD